ncbi:hypothetical protein ISCGN_012418 [Ixodes scapularis]
MSLFCGGARGGGPLRGGPLPSAESRGPLGGEARVPIGRPLAPVPLLSPRALNPARECARDNNRQVRAAPPQPPPQPRFLGSGGGRSLRAASSFRAGGPGPAACPPPPGADVRAAGGRRPRDVLPREAILGGRAGLGGLARRQCLRRERAPLFFPRTRVNNNSFCCFRGRFVGDRRHASRPQSGIPGRDASSESRLTRDSRRKRAAFGAPPARRLRDGSSPHGSHLDLEARGSPYPLGYWTPGPL